MLRKILLSILFTFALTTVHSKVSKQTADSIANLLNQKEVVCDKSCPLFESENSNAGVVNTLFIDVLAVIGTIWLYTNYKKKYFLGAGTAVIIIVTGSLFFHKNTPQQCAEYADTNCKIVATKQITTAANKTSNEFQQMDSTSTGSMASTSDEFSSIDSPTAVIVTPPTKAIFNLYDPNILDPIIAFVILTVIGIGIRYHAFVRFRGLFMLAGVAYFGFYRGACNCMIGSFQSLILGISSWNFIWTNLIWLGVLIIATYLFGRVWCGWLCHLGGIQDFLFHSKKLKLLSSPKSQKYLRIIRYSVLAIWVLQLILTHQNIFCEYDPFKTLFNLIITDWVSVVLLLVLLVSSVLIYRPFCRIICPVGVILGWISLLPGARKMRIKTECINCGACSKECEMHAINKNKDNTTIDSENCISCGECSTICRKGCIKYNTK